MSLCFIDEDREVVKERRRLAERAKFHAKIQLIVGLVTVGIGMTLFMIAAYVINNVWVAILAACIILAGSFTAFESDRNIREPFWG